MAQSQDVGVSGGMALTIQHQLEYRRVEAGGSDAAKVPPDAASIDGGHGSVASWVGHWIISVEVPLQGRYFDGLKALLAFTTALTCADGIKEISPGSHQQIARKAPLRQVQPLRLPRELEQRINRRGVDHVFFHAWVRSREPSSKGLKVRLGEISRGSGVAQLKTRE